METRMRMYPTARQKKKLWEMMAKHPELIASKVTSDFSHKEMQRLWLIIADECNIIPGVKKTWRQWRKTWQDMKSKRKKRQVNNEDLTESGVIMLSEKPTLDFKYVSSTTANSQDATEYEPLEIELENHIEITDNDNFANEIYSNAISEPESPPEAKVFIPSRPMPETLESSSKKNLDHSNSCIFNCDILAVQEQKKLKVKEDYYNFKQEYLRQKLLLMREQTEALKNIAEKLSK